MKLISDFDGVLTELSAEAQRVREIFESLWFETLPASQWGEAPRRWLKAADDALRLAPDQNGWWVKGRISAFTDEDHFIGGNGVGGWLDIQTHKQDENGAEIRRILTAFQARQIGDFKALSQAAYTQMVKEVMSSSHASPIDEHSKPVLEELMVRKAEVVVVSNSGSDRILDIFKKAQLTAFAHSSSHQSEKSLSEVRVRGGAQKFELGEDPRPIEWLGRRVDVNRPVYESMLIEENPDAVMGDVFSLDLAMPLALVQQGKLKKTAANPLRLILRTRDYTPEWSKKLARELRVDGVEFHLLDDLRQLPGILGLG